MPKTLDLIAGGAACALFVIPLFARAEAPSFDVVIRGGTVYDGTGAPPRRADVGIRGDRIAAVGDLAGAAGGTVVDAAGLAVAPGFINMLSWATDVLIADGALAGRHPAGRHARDLRRGRVDGARERADEGPRTSEQGDIRYEIEWTTLGEYLRLPGAARGLAERRVVRRRRRPCAST